MLCNGKEGTLACLLKDFGPHLWSRESLRFPFPVGTGSFQEDVLPGLSSLIRSVPLPQETFIQLNNKKGRKSKSSRKQKNKIANQMKVGDDILALKAPSFNNRARKRRHEGSEEEESVEESERDLEDKDYRQSG